MKLSHLLHLMIDGVTKVDGWLTMFALNEKLAAEYMPRCKYKRLPIDESLSFRIIDYRDIQMLEQLNIEFAICWVLRVDFNCTPCWCDC